MCLYFVVFEKIRISYKDIYKLFATISIFYSIYYIYEYLNLNVFPHEHFFHQLEISKKIFSSFGVNSPKSLTLEKIKQENFENPIIAKPVNGGSSNGLFKIKDKMGLNSFLEDKPLKPGSYRNRKNSAPEKMLHLGKSGTWENSAPGKFCT